MQSISQNSPLQTQKQRRFESFVRHKSKFQTPCGCDYVLASCQCQDNCRCELFVKICRCPWPIEKVEEFARWLAALDPESFAERPSPTTTPIFVTKRSARIGMMSSRYESGYSIWHEDDGISERFKNGAILSMSRNGESQFGGVERAELTACQCCRSPLPRYFRLQAESRICNECATAKKCLASKTVDILRESA